MTIFVFIVLGIAGISNPSLQISVDFEFKRYVVANDHCYTPYTSPSQRNPPEEMPEIQTTSAMTITRLKQPANDGQSNSASTSTTTSKSNQKGNLNTTDKKSVEISDGEAELSQPSEDEEFFDDSDQTYVSPSESDRDSDLDFSVKDRSAKAKKLVKNRLPAKVRQPKSIRPLKETPKKRQSVGADVTNQPPTEDPAKKKPTKTTTKIIRMAPSSATSTPVSKNTSEITTPKVSTSLLVDSSVSSINSTIPKIVSVTMKPKQQGPIKGNPSTIKLVQQRPPPTLISPNMASAVLSKNVKKPMANSESALFNDMTSLFSTPDVIKKVNDNPIASNRITNISVINLPPVTLTPILLNRTNPTNSNSNNTVFMSHTPTTSRPKPTVTTTIRNAVKLPNNALPNMIYSNVIQRPPTNQPQPPQPATISFQSNMSNQTIHCPPQMNNVHHIHSVNIPSSSNPHNMSFTPLLSDVDLMDGLANVEDALSDDLMQHVVKLVEDKNLQQVIDQQVLGVRPAIIQLKTNTSLPQSMSQSTPIEPAPIIVSQPTTPIVAVAVKPKPEPIQIVRSDGRVITLPPIEAPTTRGAKRRAQTQDSSSASSSPAGTPISTIDSTPKSNLVAERRVSVATSRKSMTPKNKSLVAQSPGGKTPVGVAGLVSGFDPNEVIELDDDEEEDGSDGSYNSEDDPYR